MRWLASKCLAIAFAALISAGQAIAEDSVAFGGEGADMAAWVHDPVITSVSISPDGSKLAALTQPPNDVFGAPQVTIWNLDAMDQPPRRMAPEDVKAFSVSWLNDEHLFVLGRRVINYTGTYILDGKPVRNGRWFRDKWYVVNIDREEFVAPRLRESPPEGAEIFQPALFNPLPLEPDHMLVFEGDRIARVEIASLLATTDFRIAEDTADALGDPQGNVRGRTEVKGSGRDARFVSYARPVGGSWRVVGELLSETRRGVSLIGFSTDPDVAYVSDNREGNFTVIRDYNVRTGTFGDLLFSHPDYDIVDVVQSTRPETYGDLIGYVVGAPRTHTVYIDENWANLQASLDASLPEGRSNLIVDHSDDFSEVVVRSRGPNQPSEWYLLRNRTQLVSLGKEQPLLEDEMMGETRFVTYTARDGLEIPAFLTTPATGTAPYPTIINPHGGPWARDDLSWDPLRAFFAANGYAVLQPQYRGSDGWGMDLWTAGDQQWGLQMQDDKDDGAAWLVEEGIADPDRIAMWGYSYGGYAAMAAAVRPNSPYQCAIAGAGLSELRSFRKFIGRNEFGEGFQQWTVEGLEPIREIENANIPILILHGDRDQRVPFEQGEKYYRALNRAGHDVQWVPVTDLWHSFPWLPQHKMAIFGESLRYLQNECGPDGL